VLVEEGQESESLWVRIEKRDGVRGVKGREETACLPGGLRKAGRCSNDVQYQKKEFLEGVGRGGYEKARRREKKGGTKTSCGKCMRTTTTSLSCMTKGKGEYKNLELRGNKQGSHKERKKGRKKNQKNENCKRRKRKGCTELFHCSNFCLKGEGGG